MIAIIHIITTFIHLFRDQRPYSPQSIHKMVTTSKQLDASRFFVDAEGSLRLRMLPSSLAMLGLYQ